MGEHAANHSVAGLAWLALEPKSFFVDLIRLVYYTSLQQLRSAGEKL